MIEILAPMALLIIGFLFMSAAYVCGEREKYQMESFLVKVGNVFAVIAAVCSFFMIL